jgi:phosphate transport system protein
MKALINRDNDLAHRMIDYDNEIDSLELSIDEHCLRILARWQPVASDLRFITTALKIVTDLERIGDIGVNICERTIELSDEPPLKPYIDLPKMADVVQGMIRDSLDAFVAQNAERAQAVLERDHLVDAYYGQVFRELLTYMIEDTRTIHNAIRVQAIAKYLERIGDHATNLAEMVVFMTRGKDIRHPGRLHLQKARPHGVLFLCVHNAARSQMAEAWAAKLFPQGVRIWSAGSEPDPSVDPRAVQVMREVGIDISGVRPKNISEIPIGDIDTVVTLCSSERCPVLAGKLHVESWDVHDPQTASGSDDEVLTVFRCVRDELLRKVEAFVATWS